MLPRIVLVGADGAGKTSAARRLANSLGRPAKYLYLGVNADASNVMLPTTWLWRRWRRWTGTATDMGKPRSRQAARAAKSRGVFPRIITSAYRGLRLLNLVAEETFRQSVASIYRICGYVVVCDRDYLLDFYAHDVQIGQSISWDRRLHGFFLRWFYPRPHLVILLDAPAIRLVERQTDADLGTIEARRQEYFAAAKLVPHFEVVDATAEPERVVEAARQIVLEFINPLSVPEKTVRVANEDENIDTLRHPAGDCRRT